MALREDSIVVRKCIVQKDGFWVIKTGTMYTKTGWKNKADAIAALEQMIESRR